MRKYFTFLLLLNSFSLTTAQANCIRDYETASEALKTFRWLNMTLTVGCSVGSAWCWDDLIIRTILTSIACDGGLYVAASLSFENRINHMTQLLNETTLTQKPKLRELHDSLNVSLDFEDMLHTIHLANQLRLFCDHHIILWLKGSLKKSLEDGSLQELVNDQLRRRARHNRVITHSISF